MIPYFMTARPRLVSYGSWTFLCFLEIELIEIVIKKYGNTVQGEKTPPVIYCKNVLTLS